MKTRRPRSLADYLRATHRRKVVLFVPALIMAFATGAALRKLPNLYESSARMVISVNSNSGLDLPGHLNELRRQITRREIIGAITSRYQLSLGRPDDGGAEVRRHIGIEPDASRDPQPGAFTISYRATDPETARSVTAELADRLMAQNLEKPSPDSEVQALRKRAADISSQLRELEKREPWLVGVRAFAAVAPQSSRGSQSSAEALRAQQMTIESVKDQQYKIQQQLADVDRRIAAQRQIVDQQKRGFSPRDNPTYAALIIKRAELQGQRDTLINRQELTDKHPRVAAINDQIAAINRQIEELRHQDMALVSQSPEARELAALESERNRLKIDLEVAGRELVRRSANAPAQHRNAESTEPHREAAASKLAQEHLGLKRSYNEVANELQDMEARHKTLNNVVGTQLRVIEPPDLPERPVTPNHTLLVAAAGIVGLALGAVLALLAEARRFGSLQDERDVEYYTRLPLLGAIPRTATASERRRARRRARAGLALATAMSLVATFALTKIFIITDILTLITKK